MGHLQWSRKKRVENGHVIVAKKEEAESEGRVEWSRKMGMVNFVAVVVLILGAWVAYFWGLATKNTY